MTSRNVCGTHRHSGSQPSGLTRSVTGSDVVLTRYLSGATFRNGAFDIRAGRTYLLTVTGSRNRPIYYDAEVAPRRPHQRDHAFRPPGPGRWVLAVSMARAMRAHRDRQFGIGTATKLSVITLRVVGAR